MPAFNARTALYVALILLIVFLARPDSSSSSSTEAAEKVLGELVRLNDTLANATYATDTLAQMNWTMLPEDVKSLVRSSRASGRGKLYYTNSTGMLRGQMNASDLLFSPPRSNDALNATRILELRGSFTYNETAKLRWSMEERASLSSASNATNETFVSVSAHVRAVRSSDTGVSLGGFGMRFRDGVMMGVMKDRHQPIGLHEVAALASDAQEYGDAKSLMYDVYRQEITRLRDSLAADTPPDLDDGSSDSPELKSNCTFVFLLQLTPVPSSVTADQLLKLESELQRPQGVSVIARPPFSFNATLFSPNCMLMLRSTEPFTGLKEDVRDLRANRAGVYFLACAVLKLLILVYQSNQSVTQSALSKLSWTAIALPSMIDGYHCLIYLWVAMASHSVALVFVAAMFVEYAALTLYDVRFASKIIRAQRTQTIFGDIDVHYGRILASFYLATFAVSVLLYLGLAVFRPLLTVLGLLFSSTVLAQIVHTAREGLPTLSVRFTLGVSLLRMAVPAYVFLCPHNIVTLGDVERSSGQMVAFGCWIVVQSGFLYVQTLAGPTWFVPKSMRPRRYEYHRALTEAEYERLALSTDCAICMSPIAELSQNQNCEGYMVTPCHHVFHAECLSQVAFRCLLWDGD
ncbi:hypothetical protein RI367_001749 [Sorochytrium milnesiophthora]